MTVIGVTPGGVQVPGLGGCVDARRAQGRDVAGASEQAAARRFAHRRQARTRRHPRVGARGSRCRRPTTQRGLPRSRRQLDRDAPNAARRRGDRERSAIVVRARRGGVLHPAHRLRQRGQSHAGARIDALAGAGGPHGARRRSQADHAAAPHRVGAARGHRRRRGHGRGDRVGGRGAEVGTSRASADRGAGGGLADAPGCRLPNDPGGGADRRRSPRCALDGWDWALCGKEGDGNGRCARNPGACPADHRPDDVGPDAAHRRRPSRPIVSPVAGGASRIRSRADAGARGLPFGKEVRWRAGDGRTVPPIDRACLASAGRHERRFRESHAGRWGIGSDERERRGTYPERIGRRGPGVLQDRLGGLPRRRRAPAAARDAGSRRATSTRRPWAW